MLDTNRRTTINQSQFWDSNRTTYCEGEFKLITKNNARVGGIG